MILNYRIIELLSYQLRSFGASRFCVNNDNNFKLIIFESYKNVGTICICGQWIFFNRIVNTKKLKCTFFSKAKTKRKTFCINFVQENGQIFGKFYLILSIIRYSICEH